MKLNLAKAITFARFLNNVSLNQFNNVILAQGIEQQKQSKVIEVLQAEVLIIRELISTQ